MAKKKFNEDEALALILDDEPMDIDMSDDILGDDEFEDEYDDTESQVDLANQLIAEFKSEEPDANTIVSILESLLATLM